ncbi:MAG: M23 family metallopeptidase [Pyrinomonadaceae bacterium]
MQKDKRHYTFLFTHSYRSKIYIRRIEISKKRFHNSAVAAIILSVLSIGIFSTTKLDAAYLVKAETKTPTQNISRQISISQPKPASENKALNYERPVQNQSNNTGGPAAVPFQLTNAESETEENAIEAELVNIEKTSSPENLPTMWAHLGKINNEFGFRRNPFGGRSYEFHPGLDIGGEKGDIVIAPAGGVVVKAGWQGGYGNLIEVDHGNGLITRYGHLSKIEVQAGDVITRGQEIGLIGSTGRSTGPHLHFEVRLGDKAINPRRFLPPELPN